jgi:hypothetical protein
MTDTMRGPAVGGDTTPRRSVPTTAPIASCAYCSVASISAVSGRIRSTSAAPSRVIATRRLVRSTSRPPSTVSSRRTVWLTRPCVRFKALRRAAEVQFVGERHQHAELAQLDRVPHASKPRPDSEDPASGRDVLPCDPASVVAGEEHRHVRHVIGLSDAPERRRRGGDLAVAIGKQIGVGEPGRERVDGDAAVGELARARTNCSTAPLVPRYSDVSVKYICVPPVEVATIRPPSRKREAACCSVKNAPLALIANMRSKSSSVHSTSGLISASAALANTMSSGPSARSASSNSRATSAGRARSAPMATALPPLAAISATTSVARSRFTAYPTATEAPRAANPSAIARPIPRDAPVTIALLPSSWFEIRCMDRASCPAWEPSRTDPHTSR